MSFITAPELELWQRAGFAFALLDVRRAKARADDGTHIDGGTWLDPAACLDWKDAVRHDRPLVAYCAQGHEISQGLTAALRAMGADARHLAGGIAAWKAAGQPARPIPDSP
jgi:thiosulfate sulfurtransferase